MNNNIMNNNINIVKNNNIIQFKGKNNNSNTFYIKYISKNSNQIISQLKHNHH